MNAVFQDRLPDELERENADQLRKILASIAGENEPTKLNLSFREGKPAEITLAPALTESLLELLRLIASGSGVTLMPLGAHLTTQQAADLLNVSRPYLIKLLEGGEIPFSKVGRHRRIKAEDLFTYKRKRDECRAAALSEIARSDAELGLL
jgi:excisionase family DNA binding protein